MNKDLGDAKIKTYNSVTRRLIKEGRIKRKNSYNSLLSIEFLAPNVKIIHRSNANWQPRRHDFSCDSHSKRSGFNSC